MLSEKGWYCFTRTGIIQQIKKSIPNSFYNIPSRCLIDTKSWDAISFARASLLQKYYERKALLQNYLIFSFTECSSLLFGCEVSEDPEVHYSCAIISETELAKNEVTTLQQLITSKEIDSITLLLGNSTKEKITSQLNLDENKQKKVTFYIWEDCNV